MRTSISQKEAKELLSEVDADDILVAARMHYPSGIHDEWIGTLEEMMWFLSPASEKDIPAVSIEGIASWIENAVGDKLLADEVRMCEKEKDNFADACEAAYHKVANRVSYLQDIAKGGNV
jgi:aldehyde:ferredoxin oxidoreductase